MGSATCNQGGRPTKIPGSFGHYDIDTQAFADWGIDYVKVRERQSVRVSNEGKGRRWVRERHKKRGDSLLEYDSR